MPRIEASTVAEHRDLVLGRVLDAFGAEMHDRGFSGVTLAHVAAGAGLARSSIYNYTTDKHDLMLRFVDRSVARYLARTRDELAGLPSAASRLDHVIATQIRMFLDEPGAGSGVGMLAGGSLPASVFEALREHLSGVHGLLAEVVAEGVESGEFRPLPDLAVTVEFIGAMTGSQRMPVGEGRRDLETAIAYVQDFVRAALRAE